MPWEIADIVGTDMAVAGLETLDILPTLDAIVRGIASPFDQVMALEHTIYLKNCLLRDADWAGMAHSLEIRTPLVDTVLFAELIELRSGAQTHPKKRDFAQTPIRPLPAEQQARSKTGFNVPVREWLTAGEYQGNQERGLRAWGRYLVKRANVAIDGES
jgi:asparagine synthase (glutamine-hydrolysing)